MEAFRIADTPATRANAIGEAIEFAKVLLWIIEPLARETVGDGYAAEYHKLASALTALVGVRWETDDSQFPPDGGRQLILDRLEAIDDKLNLLLRSAPLRRLGNAQTGKAGQ